LPLRHKFENIPNNASNFGWVDGFATSNAILSTTPYDPEVLIVGTFNHGWSWNNADFFYGRGMYMWPVLSNLFIHNSNIILAPRNQNNIPNLDQIFEICSIGKLCFADVILGLNPVIPYVLNQNNIVTVNGNYNWDSYSDVHLNNMGVNGWLDINVNNILEFVHSTPTIKYIYFTFATGGAWLVNLRNIIIASLPNHITGSIYTPTGMRLRNTIFSPNRASTLAHHWVWCNSIPPHLTNPVLSNIHVSFDRNWLIGKGVNPNNF